MPILTDPAIALAKLKDMVMPDVAPVLTIDLGELLEDFEQARLWEASTVFSYGEVVIPTAANRTGQRYQCKQGGTTGTAEPAWPTSQEARVTDGTAIFEEAGNEYDLWDLNAAACKGWKLKMALAAQKAAVAIGPVRKEQQQVFQQCKEMMLLYAPVSIG
jgi:hypothetical protein